uniref:Uncharacterized protein n=1 Tax=Plectus sambesii TaxID=2011161 RepID=A0A914X602_9BILA
MFSSSTQKRHWTFSSQEALNRAREEANQAFRSKYDAVIEPGEDVNFLSAEEELQLCKLVTETGIRFSHSFRPPMWPG